VKERWVCDSDAATAYVGERLESLREAHELASWKDLRCGPKFAAAVANAGFTWDGPSILSPEGKRGTMRVPSWLDREAYEYEVRFEVERMAGDGPLTLLFPLAGRPQPRDLGAFVMDGEQGTTCGFDGRDRKPLSETGEARQEPLLRKEQPMVVHLTCRTSHVRVEVDGTSVASLKDLNRLHLPKPLRDQFADKLDALHVRTAEGTRFRFRGLGWRLLPKHDKDVPLASTQAKRVQDMMPLGTTWTGKSHRDEVAVTAKVVARNQVARTATLDLRGHGRNRWNVRIAVSTNANGTTFEIDGAQRKDAKVAIYNETGNGTVANGTITMKWDWKNSTRGKKGYSEDGFSGRK
jgi:hypothetical protein